MLLVVNGGGLLEGLSVFNLDVTKVAEFGSSVSARIFGVVAGAEKGIYSNIMTDEMPKAPIKSIYTDHHFFTSVNDIEMTT